MIDRKLVSSFFMSTALLGALACSSKTRTVVADASGGVAGAAGDTTSNTGGFGASAGAISSGGSGAVGGQPETPETRLMTADKLDVLFVVDNSLGTQAAQALLAESAAVFVARLVNPPCVDSAGLPAATQPEAPNVPCPDGYEREFPAVRDMHIGAITSSLGAHGGDVCSEAGPRNDKGHLLPTRRTGIKSFKDSGFLSWDATGANGVTEPSVLVSDLSEMIVAAGSEGCGYEAPLEAMYRFLVDPEPPSEVVQEGSVTVAKGLDQTLLNQRKAFLRGDSAVAIVLISDENDCSIADEGAGWALATLRNGGSSFTLWRSTSACEKDPNDKCCRSCGASETVPPEGCDNLVDDAQCRTDGTPARYSSAEDDLNLRCWQQKRRYGFDGLYPIRRYVEALTNPMISDRTGKSVQNPLFVPAAGKLPRASRLVLLTGIVGVPWQDVSTSVQPDEKLGSLNAKELANLGRWQVILGNPAGNVPPGDPLMIETWRPRTGVSPVVNAALAPETSMSPQENPINGHEYVVSENAPDDLQYACIFPLPEPKVCARGDNSCLCSPSAAGDPSEIVKANKPICQPPAGGPPGTTQYYAKAHPGLRHLALLEQLGERGIVGSVCPAHRDKARADFGYASILKKLTNQLGRVLQ